MESRTTRRGLILIALGFLLSPIPYLYFASGILGILGGTYLARVAKLFGSRHSKSVTASLILYSLGTVIGVMNMIFFIFFTLESTDLLSAFTPGIGAFLIINIVTSALVGIAILFFTYTLQDSIGKMMLWAGYVVTLAMAIVTCVIGISDLNTILEQACNSALGCQPPSTSSLLALQPTLQLLGLLGFIPATINTIAYNRAWSRLSWARGSRPLDPAIKSLTYAGQDIDR